MKEQILYLDSHDDFHSIRDKIGWIQADRVLLVVPPRRGTRRVFKRQLDLLLVQRHTGKLGAKLALVTDDPNVCDFADTLGIQVFDRVDDSHLRAWRSRRPQSPVRRPRPQPDPDDDTPLFNLPRMRFPVSPRLRLAASGLVFFSAIAVVTWMLALTLPSARILLVPRSRHLAATVRIVADPAASEVDADSGRIPAETRSAIVSGSAEVATTGVVDEATQRAGGFVTFTNLTNLLVRIPAGTAVRTTGGTPIRFVTQEDVRLEARKGAAGSAFALAEEPGPLGNVGGGLINSIEGPLAVQAAVINEDPTTGGEVRQVASVTGADRRRAKESLLAQLRQQGYAQLLAQLDDGEFAPMGTVSVVDILDETYDHFTGEKAERLKLEMRVEVGATVVDELLAFDVGKAALLSQLGDTLAVQPETITFSRDPAVVSDESGSIHFEVTAQAEASAIIDLNEVRSLAQWKFADQTPDLLSQHFPLARRPRITVWPSWFARMPWLGWRIEVEVQPETELGTALP